MHVQRDVSRVQNAAQPIPKVQCLMCACLAITELHTVLSLSRLASGFRTELYSTIPCHMPRHVILHWIWPPLSSAHQPRSDPSLKLSRMLACTIAHIHSLTTLTHSPMHAHTPPNHDLPLPPPHNLPEPLTGSAPSPPPMFPAPFAPDLPSPPAAAPPPASPSPPPTIRSPRYRSPPHPPPPANVISPPPTPPSPPPYPPAPPRAPFPPPTPPSPSPPPFPPSPLPPSAPPYPPPPSPPAPPCA